MKRSCDLVGAPRRARWLSALCAPAFGLAMVSTSGGVSGVAFAKAVQSTADKTLCERRGGSVVNGACSTPTQEGVCARRGQAYDYRTDQCA
ncbi:MAG: hypothetical protein AAF909_10490 [Pseudomonadota bacterium]